MVGWTPFGFWWRRERTNSGGAGKEDSRCILGGGGNSLLFKSKIWKKVFSIFLGRISSTQIFSACDDKEIDHRIICAKMHPDRPWWMQTDTRTTWPSICLSSFRRFSHKCDYFFCRVTSLAMMKVVGIFKTSEWKLYFPTTDLLCEFGGTNLDYFPFWTCRTARSLFQTPTLNSVWCYHPHWSTDQEPVRSVLLQMLLRVPIFKSKNTSIQFLLRINVCFFVRSWLYNSERSSDGVLHSHPIFMGMDDGRLYYGIYLETGGAGIEIEAMPG